MVEGAHLVEGGGLTGRFDDLPPQVECSLAGLESELLSHYVVELIELPKSRNPVATLGIPLDQREVGGFVCGVDGQSLMPVFCLVEHLEVEPVQM